MSPAIELASGAPLSLEQMSAKTSEDWYHYLPPPDRTVRDFFYLTSVGHSTVGPHDPYPKQLHPRLYHFAWSEGRILPEFLLLLIVEGAGVFESKKTGLVQLTAGQVMILPPNLWHRYRPDPEVGWTERWMHFDGAIAFRLFAQEVDSSCGSIVDVPDLAGTEHLLDRLVETVEHMPNFNSVLLSMKAMAALESVVGDISPAPMMSDAKGVNDPVVAAAVDYIWTRGRHVLNVPEVVDAIGVTRRTLERHMLMTLGHGVLEEIINCRFSRAERLLRSTNLPLKVIVSLSGFGSLENMRQIFIVKTRMSPGHYRQFHQSMVESVPA